MAERPALSPLRQYQPQRQAVGQEYPCRTLQMLRLPEAIHCPAGHPVRIKQSEVAYLAARNVFALRRQKSRQQFPLAGKSGGYGKNGLAGPSTYPRSDAAGRHTGGIGCGFCQRAPCSAKAIGCFVDIDSGKAALVDGMEYGGRPSPFHASADHLWTPEGRLVGGACRRPRMSGFPDRRFFAIDKGSDDPILVGGLHDW